MRFDLLKRRNINLEKRIRELENRLLENRATLYFADGSTRHICADGVYLLDLMVDACDSHELSRQQAEDLELIRQCVASKEPSGSHLIDLIRCFLHGPVEPASK